MKLLFPPMLNFPVRNMKFAYPTNTLCCFRGLDSWTHCSGSMWHSSVIPVTDTDKMGYYCNNDSVWHYRRTNVTIPWGLARSRSIVVASAVSELLATNHEVPGSIPGSTMGIFLVGGVSPWWPLPAQLVELDLSLKPHLRGAKNQSTMIEQEISSLEGTSSR